MRRILSLGLTALALLSVAPKLAHADCVSDRLAWASQPQPHYENDVAAQLADVRDEADWIGYSNLVFHYVAASSSGFFHMPAHLVATGTEIYSSRGFDTQQSESITMTLGPNLTIPLELDYRNNTGSYSENSVSYQCINDNTVAFRINDRSFVLALSNFSKFIPN